MLLCWAFSTPSHDCQSGSSSSSSSGSSSSVTKGYHDVNVRLLEPQTLQNSPPSTLDSSVVALYSEQDSKCSESITIARVAQRRDRTRDLTHRPAPFLHASASPALDAAILNASFALRTNTQTARQVLEQYGVQALLANIEYLTEADRTDDVLIEAIASASGPPLDGVSPSSSPASGSRPPFLAASESLADAVLPPSGPRLSLGSANPITLSAPCKGQTDATNVTSRQPLQASPCFISCFVSILLHSPCVSCILSFVYFMPAATAASAGWGHPPFKLLDLC